MKKNKRNDPRIKKGDAIDDFVPSNYHTQRQQNPIQINRMNIRCKQQ